MKIGIFTDSYKPYTSGVVSSISTFKEELTKLGHEIHIFAPSYPHYTEVEENVYRYYSIPSPTNPDYTLAIPVYPGMGILIRSLQLDLIHVHSPFTMGRVGLRYARKYNLPLLLTYHTRYDQYVHYVPLAHDLAKEVTIKYSSHFCNNCDHIIAPSQEIKEIIRGFEVKTPITVIPSGVPLEKYKNGDASWLRRNYPIPDKNKILLFVGRLTQEKNLPFLLESFKEVKMRMPQTTLVIIAQGPMEEELKEMATSMELSLEHDVIFTGALPFEALVNAYYSADLFVFSSLTETQGLVLIEAMAAGLPVAAVSASGVKEMVDHGIDGLLTANDTTALAGAVCKILSDEKMYRSLQANARQKAQRLSCHNMALKLEKVYLDLIQSNSYRSSDSMGINSWLSL
ncbi:MAG: glycosyltransferase family 4 protein [Syntrophomonadaceae bacterium]|nr:glycosyltransferase family 4 protein [Syntrophomonadaceae bacterium]